MVLLHFINNLSKTIVQIMNKIAIFVSGSGSNAENIINHFKDSKETEVVIVLSDKSEAFGLQRAKNHNIPTAAFKKNVFLNTDTVLDLLKEKEVNFIVLAGFLCYVPQNIISTYNGRILNIHPALLPKHGGKGMYGARVHKAVIEAGDTESGISIHHVNEIFDDGEIYFQAKCDVLPNDKAEDVERKVRALEIAHFPKVIEQFLNDSK
jgi:phosphoribosylglycinamide formyltransferase-1